MGQARILVVADGQTEAQHLYNLMAKAASGIGLESVSNSAEAMAALSRNDFEIIFVQLSEGAAASVALLNDVWKQHPRTVRFFIADTIDSDLMVSSTLSAHHFLPRPLTPEALAAALDRANSINRFVRNDRIQALVSRMRTLPSRPSLYVEIMRELRSSNACAETVGALITKDLAISAKLIQLVNSAFYAQQQQVTDAREAVLILGFETTASLVLSIEAMARFDKVKPLYFSADRVWKHSQSVARSARRMAELVCNDPEIARDAFTAGLLHDIGKLALALNFEEQYNGALKLAETQNIPAIEVEKQVFGATHAEAGAYLLSIWGLPLSIVTAVADHHLPPREVRAPFSASTALHLAELLEAELEENRARKGNPENPEYPAELGIAPFIPEFRRLVRGEDVEISAKKEKTPKLAAAPVPISASGDPTPLVTLKSVEPKSTSRQQFPAPVALIVIALVIAGGLFINWRKREGSTPVATPATPRQDLVIAKGGQVPAPGKTQPASAQNEESISKLKLQAILYNGAKSSLIINGQSFHLGDEIEGARIVSIEQQRVTLEKEGKQFLMSLVTP